MKAGSLKDRIDSFRNALRGLHILIKSQANARIHVAILILVVIAGLILRITINNWIAIAFAAGLVLSGECFNTAIEYLSDIVSPQYNETIKKLKDISAAGVLISAIISVLIGIAIFLPRLVNLFA